MKLRSDEDYIPISVCIDPKLFVRPTLKADKHSIDYTLNFKDTVNDCQNKLKALACQQAQRNKALEKQHRLHMLKKFRSC